MTSVLDSKHVFEARLVAVGLDAGYQAKLKTKGINTMAKLAYGPRCVPGSGDETPFDDFLIRILDVNRIEDISDGEMSTLRRLWHEAHAVALSEVRNKLERTEESAPRKLPVPERAARLASQQARLVGLQINDFLEPSHALIDFVCSIKDDDTLKYVEPSKCTARTQELMGLKKEQFLKPDAAGKVVVVGRDQELFADLSSEMRVRQALTRRSLALDQVSLMTFEESEKYHDFLFALLTMEVPSTHHKISLHQILLADKQAWAVMAQHCRSGVSLRPDGTYPLQNALEEAKKHPVVTAMLQPLSASSGHSNRVAHDSHVKANVNPGGAAGPYSPRAGKGKGKGGKPGGKGGKSGKNGQFMKREWPKELEGLNATTKKGTPICPDFQLSHGCGFAQAGRYCKAGLHICCKCLQTHSFSECKK